MMIELIQNSTIHGVGHIYSAKSKLSKFLWSVLFLFGVIGIIVNIVFVSMKFFSNPVIISYTFEHEPFIWPDITFCNPTAPYHFKKNSESYKHWTKIINETKTIAKMIADKTKLSNYVHKQSDEDNELEERTIAMSSADPSKLGAHIYRNHLTNIGYIKYQGGMYFAREIPRSLTKFNESLKPLFTSQIVQIRNNIPCHTFHIDKSTSVKQGNVRSLIFRFKFNDNSYKMFNSSFIFQSIFLYITNKNEMTQENQIILTPGYNNIVSLSQNRYVYTGIRRKCRHRDFKIHLYDALLQSTDEFIGNYEDCKKISSQQMYVKKCKCYSPFLPIYKNESKFPRLCLNASIFSKSEILKNTECMIRTFSNVDNSKELRTKFLSKCKYYAPIACEKLSYKVEHRKELLADLWLNSANDRRLNMLKSIFLNIFETNQTEDKFVEKLKGNIMQLIITRESQFGDLYKEEREYPFSELLSDIGGLMGLWLGLSIVGLFEIAEFLSIFLKSIWIAKQKKNQTNSERNNNEHEVIDTSL